MIAIVVGHLARFFAAQHLELSLRVDGFLPLLLALVDVHELVERRLGERRAVAELGEQLLRTIEEPGAQVVLG